MPEVSVIIPIYNVEKYLSRCLNSVIGQTYKNLEIICVNDCSPDNSLKILEDYEKKDKRIKIINRPQNGGLSAARNTGLEAAKGNYIYFLDSDDWIEENFIYELYNKITSLNLEAVCCTNVFNVYPDNIQKPLLQRKNDGFVPCLHSCQMAWCWLLKKEFLDKFDCIFPNGLKYEDLYFFHVVIRSLENVYIINSTKYYHFENSESIMGCAKTRKIDNFDVIENIKLIYNEYKKQNKLKNWPIPFFYMPKYMLNIHTNKPEFYLKLREFYVKIKDDVLENTDLYSKIELDFFNDVLNREIYEEFKELDISLIATLRKNVKKGKNIC